MRGLGLSARIHGAEEIPLGAGHGGDAADGSEEAG